MSIVGYARVSDADQSLEIQLDQLKHCDKVFYEKRSGTTSKHDKRDQLQACVDYVREGDTLVITRLDRLGRSVLHLCQISAVLEAKGVALKVLEQSIDTATNEGRLLFNMLAAVAEFETGIRAERQREGIAKAKSKGVHFGRDVALKNTEILELKEKRASGIKIKDLMTHYKLSKATIYRYLKE